ncbi:MAG: efflux RND transporter permease subunit [Candidatus Heimdallarchaeaceae archaeon]
MKLEKILSRIARIQCNYPLLVFLVVIIFTTILSAGLTNIRFQTDLNKELPQDIPAIIEQEKVSDKLGGTNTILVLVQLDKDTAVDKIKDIRDPRVMESLVKLEETLEKEPQVESVQSAASIFRRVEVPGNIKGVKLILDQLPDSDQFFNRDYSATLLYISTSIVGGEKKIQDLVTKVQEDIDQAEKPAGIKFTITGEPPIRTMLMELLHEDFVFTMIIAAVLIFVLLIILKKSFTKALLILSPLLFGLVWTFGTMGLLGIPLSIGTVAIGALIIGLGVEFGSFMLERYMEERGKNKSVKQSLLTAVPSVGSATIGSASTTIAGFLALLIATMPMIRNLGFALAMGIFYCLLAVIFISPVFILFEEKLLKRMRSKRKKRGVSSGRKKVSKLLKSYAGFLVKNPYLILIIILIFALFSIASSTLIETTAPEYEEMLPQGMPAIQAFDFISDEFRVSPYSAMVVLEVNPRYAGSDEVRDIRDPRVMLYSDLLEQKIKRMENVISVSSASSLLKKMNDGYIPRSKIKIIELMEREVVINQTTPSISFVLSQSSYGIGEIQKGLEAETQGLEGIAQGLNVSTGGLKEINVAISQINEGVSQLQTSGDVSQLILLIDQTEILVDQSNATPLEKAQIIGYLEYLKQGVSGLGSGLEAIGTASSGISEGLSGVSQGITGIETGLEKLENASSQLKDLSVELNRGLSEIKQGLDKTKEYMDIYGEEKKEKPTVKLNQFDYYISDDYSLAVIRIQLTDMNDEQMEEFVEEFDRIIDETDEPSGLSVKTTGMPIIFKELKDQVMPTMSRTSILSSILILLIVILFFMSVRYGISALLCIFFGNIFTLGIMTLLGMPISSEMAGAVTMIMALGDDFGIQITTRFRQELRKNKIKDAMIVALSSTMIPMSITTLGCLIGFRAMSLGKLTFLGTLGNMLSIGVVGCFFAAITVVPVALILGEKYFGKIK